MKILITGVAGTGKSTISKELNKRGIYSVDFSDTPGLCFWRNRTNGEKVEYSPVNDTRWFELHERICDMEKLKKLLNEHEDIVVTGIARGNQIEYLDLFDRVLLLQCSPETFVQRMVEREKPYGKTKVEQDTTVDWQKELDPALISYGAIPISTEGSLNETIDRVISAFKS